MSGTVINRLKQPLVIRLIISLLLAGACTYLLTKFFLPCEFIVLKSITDSDKFNIYHDFDNDGFSETMEFRNRGPTDHYIYIRNWNGGVIDQTNYLETVISSNLLYKDITGDRFDEIFAVTQKEDSLFLYVHDIIQKKSPLNRLLLLKTDQYPVKERRVMKPFPACIADPGIYDHSVFIFAIRGNSVPSFLPRSVYAYDLDDQRIIRQFETHSALTDLFTYDLTGDGIDEIIVSGAAYGNIHSPAKYRDDRCWLFVLDQQLNPIFEPLSFLEYPAELTCVPVEVRSERYLLVMGDYNGDKNITSMMYLINAQGKIHLHKPNPFLNATLSKPVVDYSINPSEIYGWKGKNSLIKLNHQLETVLDVETPFEDLRTLFIEDLNADGDQEIFCQSDDLLLAFNDELDLLTRFTQPAPGEKYTFRFTGPDNPIELGAQWGPNFYHLKFSHNKLHSYLSLFFVGLFVFIFLIFTAGNRFFLTLNIYLKFFRFFFNDSSDGILIIDFQGKIRYANANFKRLLDLPHQPARGENFTSILKSYPKILLLINKSIENNEAIEQTMLIDDQEFKHEVNIIVEPFGFFLKTGVSYLVKFSDASYGSTSQKIQTWSRAVQKMAHDIKTPLSTVSLNLKILQTGLEKISMSDSEQKELADDIIMIRTELENIRKMTRNFIKFSNLDNPHFQIFDLRDTIKEAVSKYQAYLSDDLDIQISIDEDIKPVWADPQQVEFILHILLENALAAIKGKGLINLNVSLAQYLDEQFAEYLEIEIADSGPGIPEKEKNRIFEPYFTTKSNGTGMGLAIAKKIIEDHHGSIDVHSKSGFGAVFRFSLPVAKEEE